MLSNLCWKDKVRLVGVSLDESVTDIKNKIE